MRFLGPLVLCILMLTGCAGTMKVTGITNYTPKQRDYLIVKYWTDAQEELDGRTGGKAALVPHLIIDKWVWSKQYLTRDIDKHKKEVFAYGDFTATKHGGLIIRIAEWRPWTIKHEACHAILYYLQYKDWITYCHSNPKF